MKRRLETDRSSIENLHSDVTLDILHRLPVESVLQCKRVCKTWRTILGDTKVGLLFSVPLKYGWGSGVQLYYGEQYDEINIDADEQYSYKTLNKIDHGFIERSLTNFVMVGSCNGLVCFIVFHHGVFDPVYICNPVTGEHVHLPRIDRGGKTNPTWNLVSGFGYHSSTNEYKVVRIYYDSPGIGTVQVYTIGSGSTGWRNKGFINYLFRKPGIYASGAIYWLDRREKCKVVAFYLADEEFRLLPSPPCNFPLDKFAEVKLVLLGGNLCVSHVNRGKCVDIWALKKMKSSSCDYHSCSWSKEFTIAWEGQINTCYEPLALTKNNGILLWYDKILSCYDPKTTTLKKLWDDKTRWLDIQAVPHMNSLVSLKAL